MDSFILLMFTESPEKYSYHFPATGNEGLTDEEEMSKLPRIIALLSALISCILFANPESDQVKDVPG